MTFNAHTIFLHADRVISELVRVRGDTHSPQDLLSPGIFLVGLFAKSEGIADSSQVTWRLSCARSWPSSKAVFCKEQAFDTLNEVK